MVLRRLVLALVVLGGLAACGGSTPTAEVEATPSSTTSSTTVAPAAAGYSSLEPGEHPVDVGPGSVMTLLLNEMPDQNAVVGLGLRPIPLQVERFPLLEGCPEVLPIARVERLAGRLSADGQIFEVLVQAGASLWPTPEAAQAAVDFFGTPEGLACEERELEVGYEISEQPGDLALIGYELSTPIDPIHEDIEGLRSFSKVVTSEQFGTEFTQTLEMSIIARGAAVWTFTISRMPDVAQPPAVLALGGEWLATRPELAVPAPDPDGDAAVDRLLTALAEQVERPSWFEPVSRVQLASTRLDDECTSFQNQPVAAANGPDAVAVSQIAASSVSEQVATFASPDQAVAEVAHYEATILDCIRSETESLLAVGFARNGESVERVTVDGVEVVQTTVDLVQTVGAQSFDVRIITAVGAAGDDAVHVSFEGLAGDEPDMSQLVVERLAVLAEVG